MWVIRLHVITTLIKIALLNDFINAYSHQKCTSISLCGKRLCIFIKFYFLFLLSIKLGSISYSSFQLDVTKDLVLVTREEDMSGPLKSSWPLWSLFPSPNCMENSLNFEQVKLQGERDWASWMTSSEAVSPGACPLAWGMNNKQTLY